jgi:hypothetical protein
MENYRDAKASEIKPYCGGLASFLGSLKMVQRSREHFFFTGGLYVLHFLNPHHLLFVYLFFFMVSRSSFFLFIVVLGGVYCSTYKSHLLSQTIF